MHISRMLRSAQRAISTNSPELLTAFAVVGTVTTAFLTAKSTALAIETLVAEEERIRLADRDYPPLERREIFEITWKLYIPPAIVGTLTIAAIVAANRVQNNRAAVMAAAYTISERAYQQYRDKVAHTIGERKEQDLRDELAQDQVRNNPPGDKEVVLTGNGEVLCYDMFTGRYFRSSMETLRKAENDINFMIINQGYASLSDLYFAIGLAPTELSSQVGWQDRLELDISAVLSTDNQPCLSLRFSYEPKHRFDKFH